MKIAILSRDGSLYSCKRLREAAEDRGHSIDIIDPLSCYMNINPAAPTIHYRGRQLERYDAVIPRIGSAITFYGTAVLRQFELLGSYPLNESVAITRARDKLRSLQLLARQGYTYAHQCRVFTRHFGISPLRYLNNQRLERARELLVNTATPVKRIAHDTGVNDPGYFIRLVRRLFRLSPARYRRQHAAAAGECFVDVPIVWLEARTVEAARQP